MSTHEIETVLQSLQMEKHVHMFLAEKVTPDIVCKLSVHEFRALGVHSTTDIMRLRIKCINYGNEELDERKHHFDISRERLETLIDYGFTIKEISNLLSVSESTIYRRMNKYNLSVHDFTDIEDEPLLVLLRDILSEFPRCGETMLRSIVYDRGIKVARSRFRDILHMIDEEGIRERRRRRLHRRVYCVAAPNHCWHVDTNHKLIRWQFIIAGGIDGFSRLVVFLNCRNNNKAETLMECFYSAVEKYGTPLRVRSDQGMENLKIAEYMVQKRGENGMITGKSTHNQRIERLWRDVYEGVLSYYYDLFYHMEDIGILDPFSEMNLYALHLTFCGKINEKLNVWCNACARHRLQTTRSSPLQLYMAGEINNPIAMPSSNSSSSQAEQMARSSIDPSDGRPILSPNQFQVSAVCAAQLQSHCTSNWTSNNFGIDIYLNAVNIIQTYN